MKTTTKNIGLYKNGTMFCVEVTDIKNTGTESIANVEVRVNVPDGLTYSSGNFPQGAYDTGANKWLVGTLLAGADLTATFCFTVTDVTKGPWNIDFTIASPTSCTDCDTNREFCVVIEGVSCADVADCVDEWPATEQVAYYEGTDPVYVQTFYINQDDLVAGGDYDTGLSLTGHDVINAQGTYKYTAAGPKITLNVYPYLAIGAPIEEGTTTWVLPTAGSWDSVAPDWSVRVKLYYIKRAASLT